MKPRPIFKTINQSPNMNNQSTILDQSFETAKKEINKAISAMQGYRKMITENHLVHLPVQNLNTVDLCNELETTIDNTLYLVNYQGIIHSAEFDNEEYDVQILGIWKSPVGDIKDDYIPLEKIEKKIYDRILNLVDQDYQQNYLADDCMFFDDESCGHDLFLFRNE